MNGVSKPSTLRIVVPKILAQKTTATLGPSGKFDAREITLSTGGLTTENIVRHIKEYAKLREEISQTLRQLGIERSPDKATAQVSIIEATFSDAQTQAAQARGEYQRLASELAGVDRQVQEVERQISTVEQLKATGFSNEEMLSRATGFRRILGRLPSKKVDAAQKAVHSLLKERTVMTVGAKGGDWTYLLVAAPTENASQTLQTLLLYDFIATDMPTFDGPDLGVAVKSWQSKKEQLTTNRQSLDTKLQDLRKSQARTLNSSMDKIQETLLLLRGSLRLGEGTTAAHIFARLEKTPMAVTLNMLQSDGVLELD
jgi:vacuolar-type H+-ATPase subunit I/STV1